MKIFTISTTITTHLYSMLWSLVLLFTPTLASHIVKDVFKKALEEENITHIQELLTSHDIDINLQNGFGSTALMIAIDQNHMICFKKLLNRDDVDVNKQNRFGSTALMLAIFKNHVTMAELLLDHNTINVNLQSGCGGTALMFAIDQNHMAISEKLLKHDDIDVNLQNKCGRAALMSAVIENHMILVEQILGCDNLDINLQNGSGSTALMLAVEQNHIALVQLFLKRNDINLNIQDVYGDVALIITVDENHVTIAQLLLQRDDIDVNMQNESGYTALTLAIEESRIAFVDLLLKHKKINVHLQNSDRKNALACVKGDHIDFDKLQDNNVYYVDLVKRTQVPSLSKNHVLLQPHYLQALYAQQSCNQAMNPYRDILLVNKIANELAEEQKTVFYQACLIAYEGKNSNYSIEAKGIETPKKSSQYQPALDADLICLLAGYLRKINMEHVSDLSDWVHLITCYLWANNVFALQHNPTTRTLQEIHFWHKQHSPYTEFLDAIHTTHERALFQVIAQQGECEAVATKHLAHSLKQKNIIQSEEEVCEKSITELTHLIVAGLNALTYRSCCIH